jgi:DNA topoisomerase-2
MNLNTHLFELVDIISIEDTHHHNMIDITVEGDESFILSNGVVSHNSAKSTVSEARNPENTAAFALTGKINNTYGCTLAQVLSMGKLTDLLLAIGLTPGKYANRSLLHFGNKIVVASDSDYDGDHIFTLLINLFYQFWPELFSPDHPPIIHRLVAPNVVVSKGDKRVHFANRTEYEQSKSKYKGWNVEYMKGLGSLSKSDWETILNDDNDCFIPIVDDGLLQDALHLAFGPSADDRKDWLMSSDVDQ